MCRPDASTCLLHPYFWDPGKRLTFLQDASDRFEIMCRDPKDANLLALEKGAYDVVGADWHSRLDKLFIENLGKFRKYDGKSVQDLLRALRNKVRCLMGLEGVAWARLTLGAETPLSGPPRQCQAAARIDA